MYMYGKVLFDLLTTIVQNVSGKTKQFRWEYVQDE